MSEVVLFPGVEAQATPNGKQPVDAVVDLLTDLLLAAQRGEVRGVAVTYVRSNHRVSDRYALAYEEGIGHDLMAGITYLQSRYAADSSACAAWIIPEEGA